MIKPPHYAPAGNLPILQKLVSTYKLWHEFLPHVPKTARYTLGSKIDASFVSLLESIVIASYLPKQEKLPPVKKSTLKLDVLKFFLQVAWEIKALDNKKYIAISEQLLEVGKMLGGWKKQIDKENSANSGV
jgi:hypothetical protein